MAVPSCDSLKIKQGKLTRLSNNRQIFRTLRDQPPLQRRLQRGHFLPPQADQSGAEQVYLMGALPCHPRPHVPGRAVGGAVALHAVHRVHNGKPGREILIQVHDHPGEIPGIGVPEMILRLDGAWNGAKHVFRPAAQSHHAVAFELAEVDDDVGPVQVGGIPEAPAHRSPGIAGLRLGEVPVQDAARRLHRSHACGGIDPAHMLGIIQAARAISHHDLSPPLG